MTPDVMNASFSCAFIVCGPFPSLFFFSSYLDVCELFDAGHLMQKVVMQALKARCL